MRNVSPKLRAGTSSNLTHQSTDSSPFLQTTIAAAVQKCASASREKRMQFGGRYTACHKGSPVRGDLVLATASLALSKTPRAISAFGPQVTPYTV